MATIFATTFDSDTTATTPSGWTEEDAGTSWTVETAPAGLSGKALRAAQDAALDDWIRRSFTRQTSASGVLTLGFKFKSGSVITSNDRWGQFFLYDTATIIAALVPVAGQFYAGTSAGNTAITGATYVASTVYTVEIHVDLTNSKQWFVINGTTYDNAGAKYAISAGATGFDRFRITRFSTTATGGQFIWLDDVALVNAGDSIVAAPGAPTIGSGSVDKWAQSSLPVTAGTGTTATLAVYRSSSSGGTFVDITSNCTITNNGAGSWTVKDKRPAYGSQAITYGSTGYYKVAGNSGMFEGAQSSEASVASVTVNKTTVETDFAAVLSTIMAASHVVSSSAGETYPGYWLMGMAYAYQLTSTAQYKTDALNQFNYVKNTLTDANGLISLPDFAGHVYRDFHGRTLLHGATAGRLLAYAGAGTDAQTVITQCDVWAKAMLDRCARTSKTQQGWDPNNQTAWSVGATITAGEIRRPTVTNSRSYRAQNAGTTHASTQPTWPTTAGATVTDNGITWKETTATGSIFATKYANPLRANSESAWLASHTYALGEVVRPTVATGRSYVASVIGGAFGSGTTEPTWPTTAGGTVVDGVITWKETTNYPVASVIEFDLNQEVECAAAFALLMTDSLSSFFTAGAYRTAANTYITDVCELLRAYQGSSGKVPIGDPIPPTDGRPMYDTLYGGYSVQTAGLVYRLLGAVNAELALFINRASNWLITDYSTEPYAGVHYDSSTTYQSNEIANRLAGSTLAGLTDPFDKLLFTTAFFNTTSGKQTLYTVTGNGTARSDALQSRYLDGRAVQAAAISTATKGYTADAIVFATNTKTYTADAFVVGSTKTYTADAIVSAPAGTKTYTADAVIVQGTQTLTYTADAVITPIGAVVTPVDVTTTSTEQTSVTLSAGEQTTVTLSHFPIT